MISLIQWMLAHGGIPTEDSYGPYLGQDGYCRADKATVGLKIKVTSDFNGSLCFQKLSLKIRPEMSWPPPYQFCWVS